MRLKNKIRRKSWWWNPHTRNTRSERPTIVTTARKNKNKKIKREWFCDVL
jgi:hypothetical protein